MTTLRLKRKHDARQLFTVNRTTLSQLAYRIVLAVDAMQIAISEKDGS
jgi:hypothetical protein